MFMFDMYAYGAGPARQCGPLAKEFTHSCYRHFLPNTALLRDMIDGATMELCIALYDMCTKI